MKRKDFLPFYPFTLLLFLFACGTEEKEYDATGTFEATEVTVSAEQGGALLTFSPNEGDVLETGQELALIDTTQLWLSLQQLDATKAVYQSQKPDTEKQIAATRQQLVKARQEQQRYKELVADGAAPTKLLDDATSQVQVLQKQLDALLSTLGTQVQTLNSQQTAVDAQATLLRDQLRRCHVLAPIAGTVLEKYVEQGEYVTPGKPLLKLACTEQMFIRAYVTSAQLQQVKVGMAAKVFADFGNGEKREYKGTVTWISSRSEFTPKTILTDDERADQVYALKVAFTNDGYAKIGMYGEVKF